MKNNALLYVILVLLSLLILVGMIWCTYEYPREVVRIDTIVTTKTDTIWKDTVITEKEFVPQVIVKKKVDTVYSKDGDTLQLITESKTFEKRLISGKDTADVKVFTTGINTSLDSLKMRLKTHNEIVTNTVEVKKYVEKKKTFWNRFHISLQVGYGYAFKSKELTPYAGVGGSFDL